MKKTKAAVRYGMETLKLSPDELFKTIESSQGYDGENYPRWLAGKIIEIAEEDGIQFSQLLIKKFNIINEIVEEVSGNSEIREEFVDIFKSYMHKKLFSDNIEELGTQLNVDWYTGLDLDSENSFFVNEKLPTDVKDLLGNDEKVSFLFKLSLDGVDKKSDLYTSAKGQGIELNSKGAMLLYRLCNMSYAFTLDNVKYGILCPTKFLSDKSNEGIIEHLLGYFKVTEGLSIKSVELSKNSLDAGDIAFLVLEMLEEKDECQDGILLEKIHLNMENDSENFDRLSVKRYSKSYQSMLSKIDVESEDLIDIVPMELLGEIAGSCKGLKDALGYVNINGNISLTSVPDGDKKHIAITKSNIKDIIVYYGVTRAREREWGYSNDISCFKDGMSGYEDLLYNCLPIFLFDFNSCFKDFGLVNVEGIMGKVRVRNNLDVTSSDIIAELCDLGSPYFSFEAKELFNMCKEYIEFSESNLNISNTSFFQLRGMSDSSQFDEMYETCLMNLKDYVNILSRQFM